MLLTTKTAPEVVDAMLPYFSECYGNASSVYDLAGKREETLSPEGRQQIAGRCPSRQKEKKSYFTAGGSEADNWALKATFEAYKGKKATTSSLQRLSIMRSSIPANTLEKSEVQRITYVDVDENGVVRLDELEKAITPETILISVMLCK